VRDKKGLSIVLKEIEYVDGSNQSYKVFHVLIGTDKCLTFLKGQFGSTISGNAVQMAKDEAPEQKHSAWVEAWEKLNVRNWLDSYKAEDAQAVKDEDKWYVTYREEGGKARQIKGFGVHPADFEQFRSWLHGLYEELQAKGRKYLVDEGRWDKVWHYSRSKIMRAMPATH
jgi:hypothetical protein